MSGQERTNEVRGQDYRDFPRLHVESKVRIANTATEHESEDRPAVVSDLSLGGARLSTPADLSEGSKIGLIPFSGLLDDHPLHKVLEFKVVWIGDPCRDKPNIEQASWREYGLLHQGSVLEVLNSWLGHLLLRRKNESEIMLQRRQHRRFRFEGGESAELKARLSHSHDSFDLSILDIAPRGLLARGESDQIPVGVHLELHSEWSDSESHDELSILQGCVVDAHTHSGSTFYRVAFDPDSELDDEDLVDWAERVGGELEY